MLNKTDDSNTVAGITSVNVTDCAYGTAPGDCTAPSNADGAAGGITVTLNGSLSSLEGIFDNFDIFWGTGDCSNAPIWGITTNVAVPEPSTLAILASALIGLALWTRRRRRHLATFA